MAFEIERTRMCAQMFGEIVTHRKSFIAQCAKVIFLLGMHCQMDVELCARFEFTIAFLTEIQIFVVVTFFVHVQCRIDLEHLWTLIACVGLLLDMHTANMIENDAFATESLVAHITMEVLDFLVEVFDVIA